MPLGKLKLNRTSGHYCNEQLLNGHWINQIFKKDISSLWTIEHIPQSWVLASGWHQAMVRQCTLINWRTLYFMCGSCRASHLRVIEPQVPRTVPVSISSSSQGSWQPFFESASFPWQSTLEVLPQLSLGVHVSEPYFPGDLVFVQQHSSLWQASTIHDERELKPTSSADFQSMVRPLWRKRWIRCYAVLCQGLHMSTALYFYCC